MILLIVASCNQSAKKSLDYYLYSSPSFINRSSLNESMTTIEYQELLNSSWYKNILENDNRINDEILKTLFSKNCNINKSGSSAFILLEKFTSVILELNIKNKNYNLPKKFKQFLPFHEDSVKLTLKESKRSYDYILTNSPANFEQKKHFCSDFKLYKIKSSQFPNDFYFPIDLVSTRSLCYIEFNEWYKEQYELLYPEYVDSITYLVLDYPIEVSYFICSGKAEIYSNKSKRAYSKGDLHKSCISGYSLFKRTNLIFEPAFESYRDNTKYLWDLYLTKIRFDFVKDTIYNDGPLDLLNYGYLVDPVPLRFYKGDTSSNPELIHLKMKLNHAKKIWEYLKTDLGNNQEIYKSYFELVLWKMYECSAFTLNRDEPEKTSFTFTSNNPKYPGNFEVFFSIYEPNLFKVKKL
jgi:hypothetical protein